MTQPTVRSVCVVLALACSGLSCAPDVDPAGPVQGVHIASVAVSPTIVRCGGPTPSPDSIYWNVTMVNTTRDTVYVQGAASYGTIIRASNVNLLGRPANMLTNLPFLPDPAVLMSRIGNLVVHVSMPTLPMCRTDPDPDKEIYTSIRIVAGSEAAGTKDYVTVPRVILVR